MIFMKILKNTIQIRNENLLILFDDMIADILSNKKPNSLVTKLFVTGRDVNIYLVFITKSYFAFPKNIRLI